MPDETAVTLRLALFIALMKAVAIVSTVSVDEKVLLTVVPLMVSVTMSPDAQVPPRVTATEVENTVVMVPDVELAAVVTGSLQLGVRG